MAVEFDGERMLKTNEKQSPRRKQPVCSCSTYGCHKLVLLIYACFYLVVGAGLLFVGVWVEIHGKDYDLINNDLFVPAIMLISVGFIITVNGLLGIIGVLKENVVLLKVFLVVTCIAFMVQVAIGVLAFVYRQEIPSLVSDNFMFMVKGYSKDKNIKMAMDTLQSSFECCGFDSYRDYEQNENFKCGTQDRRSCGVPYTCCRPPPGESNVQVTCGYNIRYNSTSLLSDQMFTMGCTEEFLSWVQQHLDIVGAIALASALPQIIGILLVYYFIRKVREIKVWYRVET